MQSVLQRPTRGTLLNVGRHKARVLMAVPFYGTIHGQAVKSWDESVVSPEPPVAVNRFMVGGSFLAQNFNRCWAEALNHRLVCDCGWHGSTADGNCFRCGSPAMNWITHFCMIHTDVLTRTPGWLERMIEELEATDADLLHAVLPIKEDRGLSSTALENRITGRVRRLTMKEICRLPEDSSFDAALAGEPDCNLFASTGLWICDFTQPWVQRVHFEVRDRIVPIEDGKWAEDHCPEDWNFSRELHRLGLKVWGTRKIHADHLGMARYANDEPWGTQERDEERSPFTWVDRLKLPEHEGGMAGNETGRLYETVGRQALRIDQLASDNAILIDMLAKIKRGEIDPRQIVIEGDVVRVFPREHVCRSDEMSLEQAQAKLEERNGTITDQ